MNPKTFLWTVILYSILIGLNGSIGFVGLIWDITYWFTATMIWFSFLFCTVTMAFFPSVRVKQRLRLKPNSNLTTARIWLSSFLGLAIAGVWFTSLHSPWTASAEVILVFEAFFLKFYMVYKRAGY